MNWEAAFIIGGLALAIALVLGVPPLIWARRARANPESKAGRKVTKGDLVAVVVVVVVVNLVGLTAPFWAPAPVVVTVHDVSYARRPEFFPYRRDAVRRAFYRRSAVGATLEFFMPTNHQGTPLLIGGLAPVVSLPLCPGGCQLGVAEFLVTVSSNFLSVPLPRDFNLIGLPLAFQGLELFVGPRGACGNAFAPIDFFASDTVRVVVQ